MFEINGKYTSAKVMIDDVEESCVSQITKFVNHPAFTNPIAIMPDCHAGKSSCIGFTMEMTEKVIPNIIGVDINCAVLSFCIGKELPMSLSDLDTRIRQRVPFGMKTHDKKIIDMANDFPWKELSTLSHNFCNAYQNKFNKNIHQYCPKFDMNYLLSLSNKIGITPSRVIDSIGTLGGG